MDGVVLDRRDGSVFAGSKLDARPAGARALVVEVREPSALSRAERAALLERCRGANMAIYACAREADEPDIALRIASQMGLGMAMPGGGERMGGIARVPWHTAGHGNAAKDSVRATLIHCASGGADFAMADPELAWLALRDEGQAYVDALAREDAFCLPHGRDSGHAVFGFDAAGDLQMRFSEARDAQRWKCDATVAEAAARLRRILDRNDAWIVRARLEAGMGIVSNNVLVTRSMLSDTSTKIACLAFRERIRGT